MLPSGYLLSELMIALLLIALSATSFTYYGYHMALCHSDALRECYALSLASDYLDSLEATGYREDQLNQIQKGEYTLDTSLVPLKDGLYEQEEGEYQKRFRVIKVKVTWKTSKKIPRTVTIMSGMIADEEGWI